MPIFKKFVRRNLKGIIYGCIKFSGNTRHVQHRRNSIRTIFIGHKFPKTSALYIVVYRRYSIEIRKAILVMYVPHGIVGFGRPIVGKVMLQTGDKPLGQANKIIGFYFILKRSAVHHFFHQYLSAFFPKERRNILCTRMHINYDLARKQGNATGLLLDFFHFHLSRFIYYKNINRIARMIIKRTLYIF